MYAIAGHLIQHEIARVDENFTFTYSNNETDESVWPGEDRIYMHFEMYFFIVIAHCKKGFVILTFVFLTRIATVDMVLWDDTRIVPCDSQLWAIQCTSSSYRNN